MLSVSPTTLEIRRSTALLIGSSGKWGGAEQSKVQAAFRMPHYAPWSSSSGGELASARSCFSGAVRKRLENSERSSGPAGPVISEFSALSNTVPTASAPAADYLFFHGIDIANARSTGAFTGSAFNLIV